VSKKLVNYKIDTIAKKNNSWSINGDCFDHIISTIPLPELGKIYKTIPSQIAMQINSLQYNSISTSLFKYDKSDTSWIYYPSPEKGAHRTVFQGNLANDLKGAITFEKTGKNDVESHIKGFDISKEDFIAESFTEYAYPVFDLNYEKKIMQIRDYFDNEGIGLVGRFAEWKYYNMDTCIKAGFDYIEQKEL